MAGKGYAKALEDEKYSTLKAALQNYRLDTFVRENEAKSGKNKGNIFAFVRGLRFSALLIYEIRRCLSSTDFEVSWGQIIDDEGQFCSNECDIIIHQKGHIIRWNGSTDYGNIMDFKFIEQSKVIAVISCKSYIKTSDIEVDYYNNLSRFVDTIWLFAECCGPRTTKSIREKAKAIGYKEFWKLYSWNKKSGDTIDAKDDWHDFIQKVKELGNN